MAADSHLWDGRQVSLNCVFLALGSFSWRPTTGGDATRVARVIQKPEQVPTLASAGIDKNLPLVLPLYPEARQGRRGSLSLGPPSL
jgi:hypothetical protein